MTEAQSTQAEIDDFFVADTGYHLCRGCKHIRVGAWSFSGLCSFCCAVPRGGLRTRYDKVSAPLDLVPEGSYIPPGTAQPPRENTLPPALQLHGEIAFQGTITFAPVAPRAWG